MADGNEFILSLIGELDEGKTKANVQKALENVSKNVSLKSNSKAAKNKVTVFDKEQLEKDGIAYLKSAKNIESQIAEITKGIGDGFKLKQTIADDGSVSKFVATIYEGTKAIQTLNFEAAKFTDNTIGFRQTGGTASSGIISVIEQETLALQNESKEFDYQKYLLNQLADAKATLNSGVIPDSLKTTKINEDIRLLQDQINNIDFSKISKEGKNHLQSVISNITNVVEAQRSLNTRLQSTEGVWNIPALEKEGISFYKNTVGVVEQVKRDLESKGYTPKISILDRTAEGEVTAFTAQIKNASGVVDNLYYNLVRLTDGEKEFNGFMSSYGKQVDNSSEVAAKAFQKQSAEIAKTKREIENLMTTYLSGNGKVLGKNNNIDSILNMLAEAETLANKLMNNAGKNTPEQITGLKNYIEDIKIAASEYIKLEDAEEKEANKHKKENEEKIQSTEKLIASQKKLISSFEGRLGNIENQYIKDTGSSYLKDAEHIEDINKRLLAAKDNLLYIKSKVGTTDYNTEQYISNLEKIYATIEQTAKGYYQLETEQKKSSELSQKEAEKKVKEAERIAKAYDDQKYKLQTLSQEARKLYDSTFNGKNNLVNEKNITNAQNKLKNLSLFIDGLYTKHNKGDIIPEDALTRFDLKLKETTQDIKNMKDEESIAIKAASGRESQLDILNKYSQKVKDIRANFSSGRTELFKIENIETVRSSLKDIEDEIDKLKSKAGQITEEEIRNLLNMTNGAKRLANTLYEAEESERKTIKTQEQKTESYQKQTKVISDLESRLQSLKDKAFIGNNALKDSFNVEETKKGLEEVTALINQLKANRGTNKVLDQSEFDAVDNKLKEIGQDISVFKDIESLMNKDKASAESQLNVLSSVENKILSIQSKMLDGNKITTPSYFSDIDGQVATVLNYIETLRAKAGSVTEEESRKLSTMVATLQREGDEYARIDANLQNQKKTLDSIWIQLENIFKTTISMDATKPIIDKDRAEKALDIYEKLAQYVYQLRQDNTSGEIISVSKLQEASNLLAQLNSQINVSRQDDVFFKDYGAQNERLQTFIASLKNTGLYTGELKKDVDALAQSFNNVSTPKELEVFKGQLDTLSERAKRAGLDMKTSFATEELQQKIRLLSSQVVAYMNQNTKAVAQFKSQFDALKTSITNITDNNALVKAQNEFKILQQNISNAGKAGLTFGERMAAAAKKFLMWTGMTNVVMYLVRSIKQMITHTKELDSAMTFLKRVTDETDTTYKNMFDNAIKKAKELNSSVKDLINSTAEFAKLGFDAQQAEQLAEATTVYARVGQLDMTDATESIVSTLSGFKDLDVNDVWKIVDEFDNVGKIVA